MSTKDTEELLRAFTAKGSEDAFQELIARYIDLVYSVALRRVGGNAPQAQDVAQTVFTDFAGKARSLSSGVQLGGWLHRHTCFVAANFTRSERRRQAREQIAVQMNTLSESPDAGWKDIAPVLDDAIDQLEDTDRNAVVLRFYEQRDLRGVGAALGITEDAAQKRVSRALDKLRALLTQRGIALSGAALATALASEAVCAAPVNLGQSIGHKALARTAASAGILTGFLALLSTTGGKGIFGAAVLVVLVAVMGWPARKSSVPVDQGAKHSGVVQDESPASLQTQVENVAGALVPAAETLEFLTNRLRLIILAADSGKPVPNVQIDYRGWEGKQFKGRKFFANREGVCDVTFSREATTQFQLTTRTDGFADTRLYWRPDRGESVASSYTLRLGRPVRIGGRVVDADEQAVPGAKVGFNHESDPATETPPEDHQFSWIEVTTDADGRWEIDRIAPEMIRRIYGSARHPEHVNTPLLQLSEKPEVEKQLREGTHVFRLGRSINIHGLVVDPDGQPVSEAKILVGSRGESGRRETVSSFDGTFTVAGCKSGKNLVTAEAKGFAPVTVQVQASADSEPLRISLQPSKTLRLRVLERTGQPVPRAYIWLRNFDRGMPSTNRPPPLQASFSPRTDDEGRVVWEDAPDQELVFDVQAHGFMRLDEVKVRPDGKEHIITVPPALTVLGAVRDAASGEPVPRFRIVCGWPDAFSGVRWSTLDRFWLSFAGGEYRHSFDEALVSGTANRGYVLKFEAEGYAPSVSRTIRADEGEARIDVTLNRASNATVTVLRPDGKPASAVDVGLVSVGASLRLTPGGFARSQGNAGARLLTDAAGRFHLPPDPTITRVIAAHGDGYAESTPAALAAESVLRLQPWGRVEGSIHTNGQPVVGRAFVIQSLKPDYRSFMLDSGSFRADSDSQGHFTFPKVPPGNLNLARLVVWKEAGEVTASSQQALLDVEVQAGETATVSLGAHGHAFILRLRWPEEMFRDPVWRVHVSLQTMLRPLQGFALNSPEALAKARATVGATRAHSLQEQPDGLWAAEEVLPGNYVVHARVVSQAVPGGPLTLQAVGETALTIPADPPGSPLDLGELQLRRAEQP